MNATRSVADLALIVVLCAGPAGAQDPDPAAARPGSPPKVPVIQQLWHDPNLEPPRADEDMKVVQYAVRFTADGRLESRVAGTRIKQIDAGRPYHAISARRTERPDYWIVVTDEDGNEVHWIGVDDPRDVIGDHVIDPRTGELAGGVRRLGDGLLTVLVPFVAKGQIRIHAADRLMAIQESPLDVYSLDAKPPPPPGIAKRGP